MYFQAWIDLFTVDAMLHDQAVNIPVFSLAKRLIYCD